MAIHLIDLKPTQIELIHRHVAAGRYTSLEQFLAVAVQNQIVLETSQDVDAVHVAPTAAPTRSPVSETAVPRESADASRFARLSPAALPTEPPELVAATPASGPVFGQYYRFLPLKLVARAICAASWKRLPDLENTAGDVAKLAAELVADLRREDTAPGLNLTTGFPSDDRDSEKSLRRFLSQYLGRVRGKRLDGFGSDLGFFGITADDPPRIGLTQGGFAFARLPNPVIDDARSTPLSSGEIDFLLSWIRDHLRDEYAHLLSVLKAVTGGADTPALLGESMSSFYRERFSGQRWTEAKSNLTRSGAVSRLSEMELLRSVKGEAGRVTYNLTNRGISLLAQ